MGAPGVSAFLTHLATERDVSASVWCGYGDTAPDMISPRAAWPLLHRRLRGRRVLSLMPRRSAAASRP